MAKIHSWDVPINGTIYHISCQRRGNQYEFKVGEDSLCSLYADPGQMAEQDVIIGGKRCQVAAYEGVPDIIVDGILMGVDAKEKKNAKRRKLISILVGICFMCIGVFAAFSYTAMVITDIPVFGGIMPAVFGGFFFVSGIILLLSAKKKENK